MEHKVTVPIRTPNELLEIYLAIHYDYPELKLIWDYDNSKYFEIMVGDSVTGMDINLKYNGSREELQKKLLKINAVVEDIINQSIGDRRLNDRQCIEAVYRCIAERLTYSKKTKKNYPEYAYTMECLLHGDGVCAGMASVFSYVLGKLQIPVEVISGMASGRANRSRHAWNIVKLADGSYRHMDVTWDAGRGSTTYLALDDLAMRARRHEWNIVDYPVCM